LNSALIATNPKETPRHTLSWKNVANQTINTINTSKFARSTSSIIGGLRVHSKTPIDADDSSSLNFEHAEVKTMLRQAIKTHPIQVVSFVERFRSPKREFRVEP
jgi:hypothetical protein